MLQKNGGGVMFKKLVTGVKRHFLWVACLVTMCIGILKILDGEILHGIKNIVIGILGAIVTFPSKPSDEQHTES